MMQSNSTSSIKGENFPAWLAFILALLGIIGCIFTAQIVVPYNLESKTFIPRIVKLNKEWREENSLASSNIQSVKEIDKVVKDDIFEPKTIENKQSLTKIQNAKKIDKVIKIDILEPEIIANKQSLTKIQDTKEIDKVVKVGFIEPEIIENKQSPKILTIHDCPTLFSFTFEKNNIAPYTLKNPEQIVQLKKWLDTHPKATIILEGYSSSKGPSESNLILSYRRSNAVKKMLIKSGILEEQISTLAFGEEIPLLGEPSTSIKNQRVSMRLDGAINCNNHSDN